MLLQMALFHSFILFFPLDYLLFFFFHLFLLVGDELLYNIVVVFSIFKKNFNDFCIFLFICFYSLAAPCSMWDLSTPTRDQNHALCSESQES